MRLAEDFFKLFQGSGTHYCVHSPGIGFRTLEGTLTVEMWEKHLKGEQRIGIDPVCDDGLCRWAALDIDDYDRDLASYVTRTPLCRSMNGGTHAYLFFAVGVSYDKVKEGLDALENSLASRANHFPSNPGGRNCISMPYFNIYDQDVGKDTGCFKEGDYVRAERFFDHVEETRLT